MTSIEFKVVNDNGNLVLTSTLLTADQVRELIENGYIDGVPSDWQPDGFAVNRILDGMSVRVADEVFILPLNAVMESLQPREADLHPLAGGERVLEVRGEYLPIVELWKVFNVAGAKTEATQGIVVILQSGGRRYALLVDQLIGQHQVVVKNLESNYRKVPGISAATILGDGSVALIVDVSALQAINREQRMANTAA